MASRYAAHAPCTVVARRATAAAPSRRHPPFHVDSPPICPHSWPRGSRCLASFQCRGESGSIHRPSRTSGRHGATTTQGRLSGDREHRRCKCQYLPLSKNRFAEAVGTTDRSASERRRASGRREVETMATGLSVRGRTQGDATSSDEHTNERSPTTSRTSTVDSSRRQPPCLLTLVHRR